MSMRQQTRASPSDDTSNDTALELLGTLLTVRVASADTPGGIVLIEYVASPHFAGLGTHSHAQTTEWLFVVDGTLACTLGEQTITVTTGATIRIAPKVVHAFWNPTAAPVRVLSVVSLSGCECYLEELAATLAGTAHWSPANMLDELSRIARHDLLLPDTWAETRRPSVGPFQEWP